MFKKFYLSNYGKIWETYYKTRQKLALLSPPSYVQWIATHNCNYSCEHCGTTAGKPLANELTTKEIKNAIDEMTEIGVNFLSATGGEPLLRKDIFEVLGYAKSKGIGIGFTTNGYHVETFKKEIENLAPSSVLISIDGANGTQNELRHCADSFEKAIAGLRIIEELGIPIRTVNTTVNSKNITDLPKLKEILLENGANDWRLTLTIPEGRAAGKKWLYLEPNQIRALFDFIVEHKDEIEIEICEGAGYCGGFDSIIRESPFFCGCGWNTCTIMADGEVMGCPVFETKEYSEGNIREHGFARIWNTKFTRFRELALDEECRNCSYINACRGGCWLMRTKGAHCYKSAWENKK